MKMGEVWEGTNGNCGLQVPQATSYKVQAQEIELSRLRIEKRYRSNWLRWIIGYAYSCLRKVDSEAKERQKRGKREAKERQINGD